MVSVVVVIGDVAMKLVLDPAVRGVGEEHQCSGVAVDFQHRAALRGAVGVVPNSDVGGSVVEFWAL